MIIPIIIPMQNRQTNCIVEQGIKYCEKKDINKQDITYISFGIVIFFLWCYLWFWIGIKVGEKYDIFPLGIILGGILVLPALIIGILSLIF